MIIFRADVSPRTGLRSLRRAAYLAALLNKGHDVLLCCREDKKAAKFLAGRNCPFRLMKDPSALDMGEPHALVFDLDVFSPADLALLGKARQAGIQTVQILGAGDARQATDIQVEGAASALLHHKFRHFNKARRKYRRKIRNIFVNLGDLLPYRDLRQVVETLHRLGFKMKIAPGVNLKKADKRNLMKIYPGIHFCGRSESPARACFEADLALIQPGEEALEAAAVGTPSLFMPMAKGQEPLADACAALGTGVRIPVMSDFSVPTVRTAVETLTQERREQMGAAGKALVDGLGVHRFLKILKDQGIIA